MASGLKSFWLSRWRRSGSRHGGWPLAHLLAFIIALGAALSGVAAPERRLVVGVYDFPPLLSMEDGKATGFAVEVLREIADRHGWMLSFREGSLYELTYQLNHGDIDVLPGILVRQPRVESSGVAVVDTPLVDDWGVIYSAPNAKDVQSLAELSERRLARLDSDWLGGLAESQFNSVGLGVTWSNFPTNESMIKALLSHQVDGILFSHLFGDYRAGFYHLRSSPLMLSPEPRSFALSRQSAALKPAFERELLRLRADRASLYYEALDRYFNTSFVDKQRRNSVMFMSLAGVGLLLALLILSRYLNHLVDRRTEELSETNERLSELNRNLDLIVRSRTLALERSNEQLAHSNTALEQSRTDLQSSLNSLRDMQSQLVEAEKMSSLGGLVAGVAHEINTPLGIAVTSESLLDEKLQNLVSAYRQGTMTRTDLERFFELAGESVQILKGNLQRAAELVQSFKRMAVDQSTLERREVLLLDYIDEVLLTLRPQLKKHDVKVCIKGDKQLRWTTYPGAMAQILTNLIMNTIYHAFADSQQDRLIEIEVERDERGLRILFRDNGRGVSAEVLAKLFEPFFTTRRLEGGTGLGLHLVYNLVTQSLKGRIQASSEEGQGLSFMMHVPELGMSDAGATVDV